MQCAIATRSGSTDCQETRAYRKRSGMLREPEHERKIITDFKPSPFVLSHVEGLREGFSALY